MNKEVKHHFRDTENVTESIKGSISKLSNKTTGRGLFTRAPHFKLLTLLRSITAIASSGIGYGPG